MLKSRLLGIDVHILVGWNDSTHRRDIETKQHATHRGNDCQKVDIVNLWDFRKHLDDWVEAPKSFN